MVNDGLRSFGDVFRGNGDILSPHPSRTRHPLCGKRLQILDGVMGGIVEEGSDQMETFIVGYMSSGLLPSGLSVRELDVRSEQRLPSSLGKKVLVHEIYRS